MICRYVYTSLIIFVLTVCLFSQEQENDIKFERISLEQEYSQSAVYSVCQDSKGFIWLGTNYGLSRYDGYSLKVYKFDSKDVNSLSNNLVWSIIEDSYGHLWIGTAGGGLNRFNKETEQFIHYQNNPEDTNSLSNNFVRCIYENKKAELWVGTDNGLNKLLLDSIYSEGANPVSPQFFTRYKNDPQDSNSLSHNEIRSICEDRFGDLWIGTWGGGLNRIFIDTTADKENKESTLTINRYINNPNNPQSISNDRIWSIYEDKMGDIWIGTDGGGLNKFDREKEEFIRYQYDPTNPGSISSNNIVTIYEDQSHTLWIGTDGGGINKYDRDINAFSNYQNNPFNLNSLSNNVVRSIYEDRSGVLWIGTLSGLNKYNRTKNQFVHYKNEPTNPNSLNHNEVRSFYEDFDENTNILWIATDGRGLNQFDRNKNQFVHYRHDPNNPNSLSDDVVLSVFKDRLGTFWIGTYQGGLNRFIPPVQSSLKNNSERMKLVFTHFKNDPDNPGSLSNNFVRSVYEDREGTLWICTCGGGLNKYDREKGLFIRYLNDPDNPRSLSNNILLFAYEDRSGQLWVGTWGSGLDKFNRKTEEFSHYQFNSNDPNSLSDNKVNCIHEDSDGILWLGTSDGLNRFDPGKEMFTHYREEDGLPNNIVYGILEDNNENLWLSTNKGLSKFNPETEIFKNYTVDDGLQSNEFYLGAYYKSKKGEMIFGGSNGFNIFSPDSIKDNPYIPPIVITDFRIFNKPVLIGEELHERIILEKSIVETEAIELSYKDNVLFFELAALHYASPEKNEYAYMMEGIDKDWNYVGNRRFANYSNLDPGEYTFRGKGSNNDGVWNEEGVSLKITIIPPFWQTWWFKSITISLIVFIVLLIFYLRIRQIRERNIILEGLVKERTQEINDKNTILEEQAEKLNNTNTKLEERQQLIEEQSDELKAQRDELHEVNSAKDKLFSIVAHDMKNPFNVLLGFIELIQDSYDSYSEEERREMIGIIGESAGHVYNLLNNLLNWSRSQRGVIQFNPTEANIVNLVSENITLLTNQAAKKSINIEFKSSQEDISLLIDTDIINVVIRNLLTNAIKYTDENGTIRLNCVIKGENVILSIKDDGIGISEENANKLFRNDIHFSTRGTKNETGTGLGLILCKEFIEKHQGKIWLESEENEGTTFFISIPANRSDDDLK